MGSVHCTLTIETRVTAVAKLRCKEHRKAPLVRGFLLGDTSLLRPPGAQARRNPGQGLVLGEGREGAGEQESYE